MRLVASGTVFDTRTAPANEKSASATGGAPRVGRNASTRRFRLGTERESGDGHAAILASRDLGETWEIRHLGLRERYARRRARRDALVPAGGADARAN